MTMWVMPFLSLAGSGFKLLGTLVMTLLNPMAVLSGIFTALAAVAGVVFSPIGLAIAAAAAGIAVFVKKMGGLQAAFEAVKDFAFKTWETVKVYGVQAWEYVQKKAQEFWVWLRPIAQLTVWRVIQVAAVTAGDAIKSVWSKLTGNGTVAWDTIRDVAIEGLLRIQFIMQNFGKWSDVMWTGMQYRAVEWGNRVLFVFTDVIPAGMKYFFDNFGNLWHAAHEFMLEQLDTMGANIVIFFKNIDWPNVWTVFKTAAKAAFDWVLNAGEATWDALQNAFSGAGKDAFKDAAGSGVMGAAAGVAKLKQEFKKVPEEAKKAWDRLPPFKMPQRQEGDIETQLRKEYEAKKDALNVTYAEFRKKRLKEMADEKGGPLGEEAPKDAEKAGEDAASKYTAGVKKEMEKLEAVLSGSSGARERMKKYLDMLSGDAPSGKGGSKGKGAGPAGMGLAGAPAGDEIGGDFVPAKKELIGQKMRAQAEAIAARNQANIDRQAAAVVAANKKRDAQADAIAAKNVAADKELDKQAALQVARNKNREKLDPNADVLAGPVAADVAAPVADKKAKGEEAKNMIEVLKKILAETAKVAVNTKDDALPKDIAVADLN